MYSNDYGPIDYGTNLWIDSLMTYQGNVAAMRFCPIAGTNNVPATVYRTGSFAGTASYAWAFNASATASSYTLNGWLYSPNSGAQQWAASQTSVGPQGLFGKLDNVKNASQTPIFAEGVWADAWPNSGTDTGSGDHITGNINLYTGIPSINGGPMMGRFLIARHGYKSPSPVMSGTLPGRLPGGVHVGFCDGHVELGRLNDLWNYYWHGVSVPKGQP